MIGVNEVVKILNNVIDDNTIKQKDIPPQLILLGSNNKKGLSANELATEIISELPNIGIPIGNLPDGSDNVFEKFVVLMCEKIITHFINNAKITTVVNAGVPVTTTGVSATGTVISQGNTVNIGLGKGIIQ